MNVRKKKWMTRCVLLVVMVIGYQLIHLCFNLDTPESVAYQIDDKQSLDIQTAPKVYGTAVVNRSMERSVNKIQRTFISINTVKNETSKSGNNNQDQSTTASLKIIDDAVPPLRYLTGRFIPPKFDPLVFGYKREQKGFLTIGIPSVRRPNVEHIYLIQTIESLINNTSAEDRLGITVVVLLADHNDTFNHDVAVNIYLKFQTLCDSGFIRVIKSPKAIYPNFEKIKKSNVDGVSRVRWRAKQNVDFAYLCFYSANISEYYLQLEDDVFSAENFTSYIRTQIGNLKTYWFTLEFSRLGYIGKLFRDSDLHWIARTLLASFDKMPGDLLLGRMRVGKGQRTPIHSEYSLFQHNGKFSSLENKMMPSIDSKFKDADRLDLPMMVLPRGRNPPAKLLTTFVAVPGYTPNFAYDNNLTTIFWAKTPKRHSHFTIQFENPQKFNRIIISTGDPKRKKDSLYNSALHVEVERSNTSWQGTVLDFFHLVDFVDGEIDTKAMGVIVPDKILRLKIQVKKSSKTWVIIRDIVLI